ncbi:hypothetical protein GCM10009700_02560 [Brevibacterium sanguinis]|uniref:glycosyltransferase family 2 protein n=1 Tax=Brevibacterium sanguinis TaxID=232444 RepID=UPI0031E39F1A
MNEKTAGADPVRLSIVIPVFNNPSHVRTAVDIAAAQTCDDGLTEVIVVDDGSTDDTPQVLAEAAARHPNVRVIRQENSGWAGGPRNTGRDAARGDYVFFHDADDRLDGDCLGAAVAYADAQGSDVVLVTIEGRGGRHTHADVFAETQDEGDIRRLVRSNYSFKLFRRSFLADHELRFPAHKIRLEDAQFCFRAYAAASKVSILADRTYYFVYDHGGGHISQTGTAPELHAQGIRESLLPLTWGPWEPELRREAMADWFRRVTLNRFNDSFDGRRVEFRLPWIAESKKLVDEFCLPSRLFEFYSPLNRARVWSLFTGIPALVEAVSRRGNRSRLVVAEVDRAELTGVRLALDGRAAALLAAPDITALTFVLRRGDDDIAEFAADLLPVAADTPADSPDAAANAATRFRIEIPLKALLAHGTVKVYARAATGTAETKAVRVGLADTGVLSARRWGLRVEVTPTSLGGANLHVSSGARAFAKRLTGLGRRSMG